MPKADNLPPSCAIVTISGNLNFLEPSGPLQACNGTAFFFFFLMYISNVKYSAQGPATFKESVWCSETDMEVLN